MYFVSIREALLIVALQRLPFQSYPLLCQRGRKRAVKSLILVIKCSGLEVTNITATCIPWPEIVPWAHQPKKKWIFNPTVSWESLELCKV